MRSKFAWFLALFLALGLQFSHAQEKTITGVITDQDGLPLPGANVLVQGTTRGTQTDFDGLYAIMASEGDVLIFTYIGQKTEERTVGASDVINVQLVEDAQALEEVIVVGFGEQTKKSLTTAVSKVEAEQIKTIATPTISGALQGSANGLQVNQNSGTPGGAFSVRIRGASSINGSNEPLYVVDGVPILSGSIGDNALGGQDNDLIANLNFADIESIQILKDASSAAIYGARGANGVVLITTKKGKAGKVNVAVNSYMGFQREIKRPEVFKPGQYYQFADIALEEAFGAPGLMSAGAIFGYSPLNDPELGFNSLEELYAADFGDSYVDAIYKDSPAVIKQTDVSISGGSETARYYANFTDFNQDGVIKGQGFDRRSLTFNANFKASERLDIEAATTVSQSDNSRINGDNNIYGALVTSILEIPGYNLFNEDGTYNTASFLFSNPLQNAEVDETSDRTFRMFSNLGLRYKLTDNLSVNSKASLERVDYKQLVFTPSTTRRGAPSDGSSSKDVILLNRWNVTSTINYNTEFGEWDLSAVGGVVFEGTNQDITEVSATQIPAGFKYPISGATPVQSDNFITENKIFSYFGRLGFSWMDKLFLEATMRADASSVFGSDNAIGYFPAASAAYIISDDDWFENNVVTNMKVRGSWGQTGNQSGIGNFGSRFLAGTASYTTNLGTATTQLGAPDLSWETTTQTNFGVDLTLFNFLDITYDYFIKETTDVLQNRPLRNSSGFETIAANVGSIENRGHEFSINAGIINNDVFSWNMQFQAAYLDNEVTELQRDAAGEFLPIDTGFASRTAVGQPLGAFFGLVADGLWQEGETIPQALVDRGISPGDVKYVDLNGDGNIDANDRDFIGNPLPRWTGNFRNTFRFAGFDLSANFQFEEDKDIFNNSNAFAGASGSIFFNKFANQLDYWTPENTDTDIPRPRFGARQSYNNQDSSRFIEDGSYIRLKEVVLGYTLPSGMLGSGMSLRIFVGGDNLVTWTDYSGLDPEVNAFGNTNVSRGTDFFTQGLNKVYKVGINFNF